MRRRSSIPGSLVLCAALAITPLLGCVTQGKYDSVVRERDILTRQNKTLRARTSRLTRQRTLLVDVASGLTEELALRDQEVDQLKQEQMELMEELETWVVAGLIKRELLELCHQPRQDLATGVAELGRTGPEQDLLGEQNVEPVFKH